jgi:hypothetical protein
MKPVYAVTATVTLTHKSEFRSAQSPTINYAFMIETSDQTNSPNHPTLCHLRSATCASMSCSTRSSPDTFDTRFLTTLRILSTYVDT